MAGKKATKADIEQRRNEIRRMRAQGIKPHQVIKELGITRRMYNRDMEAMRAELASTAAANDAVVSLIGLREENLQKAQLAYQASSKQSLKNQSLQLIMQASKELLEAQSRLALIPSEKQTIEMQGSVGIDLTEAAINAARKLKEEKSGDGISK